MLNMSNINGTGASFVVITLHGSNSMHRQPHAQFKASLLLELHVTQTQSSVMGKFSPQLASLLGQIGQIFPLCGRLFASVRP